MEYIDSHTHLFTEEFNDDRDEVIGRAQASGVTRMYLPNIDRSTIEPMLALESRYPGVAYAMMGLHPCSVGRDVEAQLAVVEEWLSRRRFSAVGEVGLDFHWDTTFKAEQIHAFSTQVDWAIAHRTAVVIHSRAATAACIDIIASRQNGTLRGIFHCFSGTAEEAERIIALGFALGIGGVLTFKNSTLAAVLSAIPLEHLVLETDSPYLAPVPHRGKRNESAYLPLVAARLADIKGVTVEEIARLTTQNALRIFEG